MSTAIGAPRESVWHMLTAVAEIVRWNPLLTAALKIPGAYPITGQQALWRCRLGNIPLVLHEHLHEVVLGERLHSHCSLGVGRFRFEAIYALDTPVGSTAQTRLYLKFAAPNSVPLTAGHLDRFSLRRFATELVSTSLRRLRECCETSAGAEVRCEALPSPTGKDRENARARVKRGRIPRIRP